MLAGKWHKCSAGDVKQSQTIQGFNVIKYGVPKRYGYDGSFYNVVTKEKVMYDDMTIDKYSIEEFPFLGRREKRLNTNDGFTLYLSDYRECNDGDYACKIQEPFTMPPVYKYNQETDQMEEVHPAVPVEPEQFYTGCPGEIVYDEPDFVEYVEEE